MKSKSTEKPIRPAALLTELRRTFNDSAEPGRAPKMQAYMKSEMPFHGVPATMCKQIYRSCFADLDFDNGADWQAAVLHLWRHAKFREERYAAIALCEAKAAKAFQTPDALPMHEEMIVTGAWWDFVDWIASHCLGKLIERHPDEIRPKMLEWSRCDNMWKRRSSIICQISLKKKTDLKLLYACIEPSLDSREFFLRKAIGWALRQYGWTNPEEVRRYVRQKGSALSPLSQREALKNIG